MTYLVRTMSNYGESAVDSADENNHRWLAAADVSCWGNSSPSSCKIHRMMGHIHTPQLMGGLHGRAGSYIHVAAESALLSFPGLS